MWRRNGVIAVPNVSISPARRPGAIPHPGFKTCNADFGVTYAKADETLRRFTVEGNHVQITGVLDRWYQVESKPEWPRADYFKVHAEDGHDYLLKHDLESDDWWLGRSW